MVGQFHHKLDAKNRFVLPAPWRPEGGFAHLYVAGNAKGGYARVVPPASFDEADRQIRGLAVNAKRRLQLERKFYGSFRLCPVDSHHRMVLPPELVDQLGLAKEILLNGLRTKFEIWEPGRFAEAMADPQSGSSAIDDLIDELGLL